MRLTSEKTINDTAFQLAILRMELKEALINIDHRCAVEKRVDRTARAAGIWKEYCTARVQLEGR